MTARLLQEMLRALLLWLACAAPLGAAFAQSAEPELSQQPEAGSFYPRLVTTETRANPQVLAALERPGRVFFRDDFESPDSLKKYIEVRGLKEGRAKLVSDAEAAHSGSGHRAGDCPGVHQTVPGLSADPKRRVLGWQRSSNAECYPGRLLPR
jgi:hypothetical protein